MSFAVEDLARQVRDAGWTAPVSAEAPAGQSAKADPLYERVTGEIAKLESPTGGAVDWRSVAESGGALLKEKSKDLLIASYFSYALYETRGLSGLVTGIGVLHGLLDGYWENCFPERARMRGRANALAWFVQRAASVLPQLSVTAKDAEQLDALSVAAAALATTVRTRFEAQAPAIAPLLEGVQRLKLSLPQEAPPPAPAPPPAAAAPPPKPPVPTAPASPSPALAEVPAAGDLSAPGAASDHLAKLGGVIASTARTMRQLDPKDPTAYRALRTGLWLHLAAPPPAGEGGKTSVPPPNPAVRDRIDKLAANAKWPELLDEAESALSQSRLWLDLHHASAQALSALGHDKAREAVVTELRAFLARLPSLPTLSFSDGSPFASQATRAWLSAEVLPAPAARGAVPAPAAASAEGGALEEALALAASGKLAEALGRIDAAVREARGGRERFRARLALAQLLAGRGKPALARDLYQRLDAEALERGLDSWEPALAAQVLEELVSTLQRTDAKGAPATDLRSLQVRLLFIDPSAAMRLGS